MAEVSEHFMAIEDRFRSCYRLFGRFRAYSSLRHVQKLLARHPQIAQRKQHHQVRRVLGQSPVLDLDVAELPLDDPKRVLDLGPDAGLGLLQFLQDLAHRRALVRHPELAGHHGHMPVHFRVLDLNFFSLLDAPVARVREDVSFLSMQQDMRLCDVMRIGRRSRHAVHQARVSIRADMGFHAMVPLVALLGLVHLRIARACAVLSGTGRCDQGGVDHRALLEQQTLFGQRGVDRGQNLKAQIVRFEQVAKAQDGALIGQVVLAGIQASELTEHRRVVQRLFHARVRQVEPLLQEMDAQHGLHGKRLTTAFGARLGGMRRDPRH